MGVAFIGEQVLSGGHLMRRPLRAQLILPLLIALRCYFCVATQFDIKTTVMHQVPSREVRSMRTIPYNCINTDSALSTVALYDFSRRLPGLQMGVLHLLPAPLCKVSSSCFSNTVSPHTLSMYRDVRFEWHQISILHSRRPVYSRSAVDVSRSCAIGRR